MSTTPWQQAPGGPRPPVRGRNGQAIALASVLVGALVLSGGATALALTNTWPFGPGNPLGGGSTTNSAQEAKDAKLAAEAQQVSFAGGVEKQWSVDVQGQIMYHLSPGMNPRGFGYEFFNRWAPIPLKGAALVPSYNAESKQLLLSILDAASGDSTSQLPLYSNSNSDKTVSDYGPGCIASPGADRALCLVAAGSDSKLWVIDAKTDFAKRQNPTALQGSYHDIDIDADGFSAAGTGQVVRTDLTGKVLWKADSSILKGERARYLTQVRSSAGRTLVRAFPGGWELFDKNGKSLARAPGAEAVTSEGQSYLSCDAAIAADRLFLFGTCRDNIQPKGMQVTRITEVPGSRYVFAGLDSAKSKPVLLVQSDSGTQAYSAASGKQLWLREDVSVPSGLSPVAPLTDTTMILSDQDYTQGPHVVNLETGKTIYRLAAEQRNYLETPGAVVTAPYKSPAQQQDLTGYDAATGAELWTAPLDPPLSETGRWIGSNKSGLLVVDQVDSPSDGNERITYYAPSAASQDSATQEAGAKNATPKDSRTKGTVPTSKVKIPSSIPANCPKDTILLAWAELPDGWVLVCGITQDAPSYVAYQASKKSSTVYSLGAKKPTSKQATTEAVKWDSTRNRYVASLADGNTLTLDYDLGTATVRSGTDRTVIAQQRTVRYIFVVLGDKVRTAAETAGRNGVFDVQTPKDTAEDQIRYMVEVLEKAYAGRALVKEALPKLENCTAGAGGYADSIQTMQAVRDNRAELLAALQSMPVDKIPEGQSLLMNLSEAIEKSHEANLEYVKWAEAANASGCAGLSPAGRAAALASDAPKERFANLWNSAVAPAYGVRTFDPWFI